MGMSAISRLDADFWISSALQAVTAVARAAVVLRQATGKREVDVEASADGCLVGGDRTKHTVRHQGVGSAVPLQERMRSIGSVETVLRRYAVEMSLTVG